jgi:GH15 family glucan-1,4-alpha-glucosidase
MEHSMETRTDLVAASLMTLLAGQAPSGAFIASPTFPTYRYSWFRDGAFIAQALDLWGEHQRARAFYDWGCRIVRRNADMVVSAVSTTLVGSLPACYLHTRYTADGDPGDDEWPNFQLDGFGTFLWGLVEHLQSIAGDVFGRSDAPPAVPEGWPEAIELLAKYLTQLWRSPSYDCWEEFPDETHISTLCALYGGMNAVATYFDRPDWKETALSIQSFILDHSTRLGYLPKFIGTTEVDAALLWACIPYGVVNAADPIMIRTVEQIERELVGPQGGVHRYADDSYYGGGAWILLTAALGEYLLLQDDGRGTEAPDLRAAEILEWIERQASPRGELPEQVARDLNRPDMYQSWVERWGAVACPLLWSHAAYLRLKHAISLKPLRGRRDGSAPGDWA